MVINLKISKRYSNDIINYQLKIDKNFHTKAQTANIMVAGSNFGCGSSREHAIWALEVNGINVVVASNFARIFKTNMYNCGLMAIEISKKDIDDMFRTFSDKDTECSVKIDKEENTAKVKLISGSLSKSYYFRLEGLEKELFTMKVGLAIPKKNINKKGEF